MYYGIDMNEEMKAMAASKVKSYYTVVRIFGSYILVLMCLAFAAFIYNSVTGKMNWEDPDGTVSIMGYFTQGLCAAIIGLLIFGAYKIRQLGVKPYKRIENGDFYWYMGYVTNKGSFRRKGSRYIFINNEQCISISSQDYSLANIGDEYLVICLMYSNNNMMKFAIKPY